jgi:D-alanyl-D-alanine carboxypeptidase
MTPKNLNRVLLIFFGLAIITLLIFFVLAFLSTTRSVSLDTCSGNLDELVASWAELDQIPGVLLHIEQDGGVRYSGASGYLSKSHDAPLSPDSFFHIASIGKLFTAATILRLAERGQIDLDASITWYLEPVITDGLLTIDGIDYTDQITVRQLLTHQSGMGNTDDNWKFIAYLFIRPDHAWSPVELIDLARTVKPAGKPGGQTSYSSPGYFLLGMIIEKVTGQPYHEAVRKEIFERLGMDRTFESTHEWHGQAPTLHHYVGWFDMTDNNPSFEFADGGFVSTAQDLAIFGNALLNQEIFDEPLSAKLFISAPPGIEEGSFFQGHGPWVTQPDNQPKQVFHAGYWGCYLIVIPEARHVVVIAMGQSAADVWKFWGQVRNIIW